MTSRPHYLLPGPQLALVFLLPLLFSCFPALAQESVSTPGPTTSGQPSRSPDKKQSDDIQEQAAKDQASSPANDRIFYAMPNYLTVENAAQTPPVSAGQKFKLVAQDSFDLFNYPWYGFLAGLGQAQNSTPGYGQGASGYAKRYGAAFADGTIENFMTGAVFASLLHEDPRYFQLGKGTFFHRAGYAASRILITRTDSGRNQFNYSEVAGAAVSAGIANAYRPASDRSLANTMIIWGTDMGLDAFTNVVKEFWPDIRKMLHKDKN